MKKIYWGILCVFLFPVVLKAQQANERKKTKVLLLGTFHFENPGLDVAKFENANILSPGRQKEVQEVLVLLKKFNPDKIFVEMVPERQSKLDSLYEQYRANKWVLKEDEIYQLGFRMAKELNLQTLHAVDYQDAVFPFDSLIKVMQAEKQFELLQNVKSTIDSIQNAFNEQLKTYSLREILLDENNPASDTLSVGAYLQLLKAGNRNNHVGSYLVSEWWRRNMIIYENILKRLNGNERNVLVIFGSSHTALLKEFMKFNPAIELIDVSTVLRQ